MKPPEEAGPVPRSGKVRMRRPKTNFADWLKEQGKEKAVQDLNCLAGLMFCWTHSAVKRPKEERLADAEHILKLMNRIAEKDFCHFGGFDERTWRFVRARHAKFHAIRKRKHLPWPPEKLERV